MTGEVIEKRHVKPSHFWSSSFVPPDHYWDTRVRQGMARMSLEASRPHHGDLKSSRMGSYLNSVSKQRACSQSRDLAADGECLAEVAEEADRVPTMPLRVSSGRELSSRTRLARRTSIRRGGEHDEDVCQLLQVSRTDSSEDSAKGNSCDLSSSSEMSNSSGGGCRGTARAERCTNGTRRQGTVCQPDAGRCWCHRDGGAISVRPSRLPGCRGGNTEGEFVMLSRSRYLHLQRAVRRQCKDNKLNCNCNKEDDVCNSCLQPLPLLTSPQPCRASSPSPPAKSSPSTARRCRRSASVLNSKLNDRGRPFALPRLVRGNPTEVPTGAVRQPSFSNRDIVERRRKSFSRKLVEQVSDTGPSSLPCFPSGPSSRQLQPSRAPRLIVQQGRAQLDYAGSWKTLSRANSCSQTDSASS